ncbi:MAG: exonuclease [Chloroflexi bacterium]|nr:MAG: exonuclease [Chloroflexota bacterium]
MQPNSLTDDQRTDEWFKARLGKATASRFKDIMITIKSGEAAGRKNYRAELVAERLTGTKEETWTSAAMQWGIDNEPLAALRYELLSGNEVQECGFYAHQSLQAGASPDGLVGDDGLIEIKCPNTATHIDTLKRQDIPYQYYWQVMGQLWITGRKWCDFISFDPRMPENAQIFITRIERDESKIKQLEEQVTTFLREVAHDEQFIKSYERASL